jgi:hypothetical protein
VRRDALGLGARDDSHRDRDQSEIYVEERQDFLWSVSCRRVRHVWHCSCDVRTPVWWRVPHDGRAGPAESAREPLPIGGPGDDGVVLGDEGVA